LIGRPRNLSDTDTELFNRYQVDYWYWNPKIEFQKQGASLGWEGGPVKASGWYYHPYCHAGCCRPSGPYESKKEALFDSRKFVVENLGDVQQTSPPELQELIEKRPLDELIHAAERRRKLGQQTNEPA